MSLDDSKRTLYENIFSDFDVDNNGFLSVKELGKCMKALGDQVSSSDLKLLIKCADIDENGKMDCKEFCTMVTIKNMLSMSELKHLREVFSSFDLDDDGAISVRELGKCMDKLGEHMSDDECKLLIESADKDADGCMGFFEFIFMVKTDCSSKPGDDDTKMREAFSLFDKNGDGHIDKEELRLVLKSLDENPTDDDLEEMFRDADADNDGIITFHEFEKILQN